MTPIRLLLTIRIFAAGITTALFGHQFENVALHYGFDFLSVSYLFAVLTFYTFLYLTKFYSLNKPIVEPMKVASIERNKKYMHNIQLGLLILSLLLSIYETSNHSKGFTLEFWIHVLLISVFIVVLDLIFDFLIEIHKDFSDNDK